MQFTKTSPDLIRLAFHTTQCIYPDTYLDCNFSKTPFRATLKLDPGAQIGVRKSASGRGRYVCWHVYRDFLMEFFKLSPNATVRTALAVYRGKQDFKAVFPETYYHNAGTQMFPIEFGKLCDCDGYYQWSTIYGVVDNKPKIGRAPVHSEVRFVDLSTPIGLGSEPGYDAFTYKYNEAEQELKSWSDFVKEARNARKH